MTRGAIPRFESFGSRKAQLEFGQRCVVARIGAGDFPSRRTAVGAAFFRLVLSPHLYQERGAGRMNRFTENM